MPTLSRWEAGARHVRCDLAEVTGVARQIATRTTSLRDGLRGARPLDIGCVNFLGSDDKIEDLATTDCAKPHDGELAGVRAVNEETPPDEKVLFAECAKAVAAYLGGQVEKVRVDVAWWSPPGEDWERRNRRVRCFASAPEGRKLMGSVKGIGNRAPKTA